MERVVKIAQLAPLLIQNVMEHVIIMELRHRIQRPSRHPALVLMNAIASFRLQNLPLLRRIHRRRAQQKCPPVTIIVTVVNMRTGTLAKMDAVAQTLAFAAGWDQVQIKLANQQRNGSYWDCAMAQTVGVRQDQRTNNLNAQEMENQISWDIVLN